MSFEKHEEPPISEKYDDLLDKLNSLKEGSPEYRATLEKLKDNSDQNPVDNVKTGNETPHLEDEKVRLKSKVDLVYDELKKRAELIFQRSISLLEHMEPYLKDTEMMYSLQEHHRNVAVKALNLWYDEIRLARVDLEAAIDKMSDENIRRIGDGIDGIFANYGNMLDGMDDSITQIWKAANTYILRSRGLS